MYSLLWANLTNSAYIYKLGSKYFIDPKAFVYETWLLVEMIYVFDLLATADDSFKNVCKKCCWCLNFSSRVDVSFSDPFINPSENLLTTAVFLD